jgi:hypothetical protein
MWIIADYEPVAAFGLRPSNTTSSGGKSLVIPTPYAIKMALLDRLIRFEGLEYAVAWFPLVRDLTIWLQVPLAVAVNRTFQKVLRPGSGRGWTETIAQREYVFHTGTMRVAFGLHTTDMVDDLADILPAINYFGRKGGFMQFAGLTTQLDAPPDGSGGFTDISQPSTGLGFGFLQRMDNMHADATFDDVSTFDNPRSDGGRVSYNVILPYRLVHHGFNHTVYEVEPRP